MTNETLSISLYKDIKSIIEESKKMVIRSVNTIMLQTYWSTRRRIVEEEQQGSARAEYGSTLLKDLSK